MKKIILQSKLDEDQALEKLGIVSKNLLSKGLISKGDELVAGVEEKDGNTLITINADLMTKDNYKNIKSEFLEVGKVISNDLKNFDELPEDSEGTKEPKNEDTHEEQKAVDHNKIKPAESVLHDTSELLFDINPNHKEMDDFKTLLFSEEEINKAPESKEERPADPKAEEKKPEEKEHDAEGKDNNDDKDPKDQSKDEPKSPEGEEKLHDLLFSDEELNRGLELHDLLFSDEELGKKEEPKNPSEKEPDDQLKDPKDEPKKECPFHDREEALKALAEYRRKAAEGKELTVAEKFFCDAASKQFSDEEIEKASKEVAKLAEPKKEEPKVEEPKKPEVKEHDDKKCFKVLCPKGTLIKDGFTSEEEAKKYIEDNKIEGATVAECKEHDDQPKDEPKDPKDEGKKEEPKDQPKDEPKEPKKPEEPKREETKMELIRRLNKENSGNTLMGRAKEQLRINK